MGWLQASQHPSSYSVASANLDGPLPNAAFGDLRCTPSLNDGRRSFAAAAVAASSRGFRLSSLNVRVHSATSLSGLLGDEQAVPRPAGPSQPGLSNHYIAVRSKARHQLQVRCSTKRRT